MRPMFLPAAPLVMARSKVPPPQPVYPSGLISYQMQISDDGKSALLELVFATAKDMQPIVQSTALGVRTFVRGKDSEAAILAEFQKHKANFQFSMFNGSSAATITGAKP